MKQQYFDLIYLAEYFLWCYRKPCNALGHRSPITGQQYRMLDQVHHPAYKAAQLAMAKVYLAQARQLRMSSKYLFRFFNA